MYSEIVLDHLANPHNVGPLEGATGTGWGRNASCGDVLELFVRVEEGRIVQAAFLAQGCPPTIAAGSVLTTLLQGKSMEEARGLSAEELARALGGLPPGKEHCTRLAVEALKQALA